MANFFKKFFGTDEGDLDIAKVMSTQGLPNKDNKSKQGSGGIDQFKTVTPVSNSLAAQAIAEARPAYSPVKDMSQVNAAAQAAAAQMDQGLNISPFSAGNGPSPYPSSLDEDNHSQ